MARQQKDSFLKRQIKEHGETFLNSNPLELQRNSIRVFRDMTFGNFDPAFEGPYLKDDRFNRVCTNLAYNKVIYYQTIVSSLIVYFDSLKAQNIVYDPGLNEILAVNSNSLRAWEFVYNACSQLQVNPDYIGILTVLLNQLRPLKGSIYSNS